ncbi:hypothetical protein [Longispora fulva]|uniref:Uncharacterized protein n=1 Tax=Longispora fulva TaxID=619741 RepID=A0A8J7GXU4_9ACTN|nr:hypothetical protein [Longispora fulva]MBG6140056.1 hypothetical protein [Longispora fulva]
MNTFKVRRRLAAILLGAVCAGIAILGVAVLSAAHQSSHVTTVAGASTDADIIWS